MIVLMALPVFAVVGAAHRYMLIYAPTNLLVRRVHSSAPRWRTAASLGALGAVLLIAMHAIAGTVAAGAPGWLNVVVIVLAWDAIKVGCLGLGVVARLLGATWVWLGLRDGYSSPAADLPKGDG